MKTELKVISSILSLERNLNWSEVDGPDFLDLSSGESLQPLLHHHLHKLGIWDEVPEDLRRDLSKTAKIEALIDERRRLELDRLFRSFSKLRIPFIVFKGTALSETIYDQSFLRPRCDTDILVRSADRKRVEDILLDHGFQLSNTNSGSLISFQGDYVKIDDVGIRVCVDLHWKVSNSQAFSKYLTFEELDSRALRLDRFPYIVPSLRDSLLIACLHRVAHHLDNEDLLWLYDIHLICSRFSRSDFVEFDKLARAKRLSGVCRRGLDLSRKWFGTTHPLTFLSESAPNESSLKYLRSDRRWIHDVIWEILERDTFRERISVLLQHAFPSPIYMGKKYRQFPRMLIPLLYLYRVATGLGKINKRLKP